MRLSEQTPLLPGVTNAIGGGLLVAGAITSGASMYLPAIITGLLAVAALGYGRFIAQRRAGLHFRNLGLYLVAAVLLSVLAGRADLAAWSIAPAVGVLIGHTVRTGYLPANAVRTEPLTAEREGFI